MSDVWIRFFFLITVAFSVTWKHSAHPALTSTIIFTERAAAMFLPVDERALLGRQQFLRLSDQPVWHRQPCQTPLNQPSSLLPDAVLNPGSCFPQRMHGRNKLSRLFLLRYSSVLTQYVYLLGAGQKKVGLTMKIHPWGSVNVWTGCRIYLSKRLWDYLSVKYRLFKD